MPGKVINWFKYKRDLYLEDGLFTTQVSETVPDQTLSMKELVDRYVSGGIVPGLRNYPEEFDTESELAEFDIEKMSTLDRARFLEDVKQQIQDNEAHLKQIREAVKTQKANEKAVKDAPKKDEPVEGE